jgi:arsenate reductase
MRRPPGVLFLCVHNAGRSQIGAGWLRHLAGDRIRVLSAGSSPSETVNPTAVEAMAEVGVDISSNRPQLWTEAMVRDVDVVVSMGCGDECPVHSGTQRLDWQLEDPAGQGMEMVRGVRDEIQTLVEELLEDLLDEEDS